MNIEISDKDILNSLQDLVHEQIKSLRSRSWNSAQKDIQIAVDARWKSTHVAMVEQVMASYDFDGMVKEVLNKKVEAAVAKLLRAKEKS